MSTEIWLLVAAGVLWAAHDIVPWRKSLTWLPPFLLGTNGKFNLDGYHITGMLHRLAFLNAGWFAAGGVFGWDLALFNLVAFVVSGASMDLNYHVLLMKPVNWFRGDKDGGPGW